MRHLELCGYCDWPLVWHDESNEGISEGCFILPGLHDAIEALRDGIRTEGTSLTVDRCIALVAAFDAVENAGSQRSGYGRSSGVKP